MGKVDIFGEYWPNAREKQMRAIQYPTNYTASTATNTIYPSATVQYNEIPMEQYYKDKIRQEEKKAEEYRYRLEQQQYMGRYGSPKHDQISVAPPEKQVDLNDPLIWLDSRVKEITDLVLV